MSVTVLFLGPLRDAAGMADCEVAAPLDWEGRLPRVSRWLDVHIMPRLEKVTAVERRYQLLMTQVLTAKMPALAARIPDDIRKDIEATVEAARASSAEAFPI